MRKTLGAVIDPLADTFFSEVIRIAGFDTHGKFWAEQSQVRL